jgi:hypothetical protein
MGTVITPTRETTKTKTPSRRKGIPNRDPRPNEKVKPKA